MKTLETLVALTPGGLPIVTAYEAYKSSKNILFTAYLSLTSGLALETTKLGIYDLVFNNGQYIESIFK